MSESVELVRDHYQAGIADHDALLAKLATALDGMEGPITAERLAGFDPFHVGGLAATADYRAGLFEGINDVGERVGGRPSTRVHDLVARRRQMFAAAPVQRSA